MRSDNVVALGSLNVSAVTLMKLHLVHIAGLLHQCLRVRRGHINVISTSVGRGTFGINLLDD